MAPPIRAASWEREAEQHPLLRHYLEEVHQSGFFRDGNRLARDMDEAQVRRMRAAYYGLMSEVDAQLGRVFDHLKATGQWDNTLIVFTCDHGEQLGDHHLLGKMGYFDQSYRIPLIVRDPTGAADATRGDVVEQFTETIDTMPTILDWLDAPIPRQCDGGSVLPFCHGEAPADWRRHVHWEFDFRDVFYSRPQSRLGLQMDQCSLAVIRDARYKYVHFDALPPLFFDLTEDPGELVNRAGDPALAGTILEYAQAMLSWRLRHAERTLTHYAASPDGLLIRA